MQQNKLIYEDQLKRALDEDGQRTSTYIHSTIFYPNGDIIMAKWATGKRSQAISDRSGMAFPYNEMVKEWNGSLVHYSEFEPKHPQIRRRHCTADAIALQNTRPQRFQQPLDLDGVILLRWTRNGLLI